MEIKCIIERIGGISGKRLFIRRFKDVEWYRGDMYQPMDMVTEVYGCVKLKKIGDKVDVLNLIDDTLLDIAMGILEAEEWIYHSSTRKMFSSFAILDFERGKVQEIHRYIFESDFSKCTPEQHIPLINLREYSEWINASDPNIKLIEKIEIIGIENV